MVGQVALQRDSGPDSRYVLPQADWVIGVPSQCMMSVQMDMKNYWLLGPRNNRSIIRQGESYELPEFKIQPLSVRVRGQNRLEKVGPPGWAPNKAKGASRNDLSCNCCDLGRSK